jgi:succinoglycan biosynthesis transport protein ExoP
MFSGQLTPQEVISFSRRRKSLVMYPAGIVWALCVIGAFVLPSRYESSTTILVQRDEILNPLIRYEMAVALTSEDRLSSFNEIIYSHSTIQALIDTLGVGKQITTESGRQELVSRIRRNIETDRRGSSFRITYIDTDPYMAQRAATALTNYFIQTRLQVENRRNELTVQFFENKLDEFRQKFESSQNELLTVVQRRIGDLPTESRGMYTQIEAADRQLAELGRQVKTYRQQLAMLRSYPEGLQTESGRQSLFDLARSEIPYAPDLRPLLAKYGEYSQRYTSKYPEVVKLEVQITELLSRMRAVVESEIVKQEATRWDLEKRRNQLVDDLKRTSVFQRLDQEKESNYGIYRSLYDDMKVKLEQAYTTRDLGRQGANQFIILDPAIVPTKPTKPNRMLIIFGGLALGLILGFVAAVTVEFFDTTIRTAKDIEVYQKPVLAYLPERGSVEHV